MTEFQLNQTTDRAALQNWAENLSSSAQLKTRVGEKNEIILYAKDRNKLLSLFFKSTRQERVQKAQDFLRNALVSNELSQGSKPDRSTPLVAKKLVAWDQPMLIPPKWHDLPKSFTQTPRFQSAVGDLARALHAKDSGALKSATSQFASVVSDFLKSQPSNVQLRFALGDPQQTLNDLLPLLRGQLPRSSELAFRGLDFKSATGLQLLEMHTAICQNLSDHVVSDTEIVVRGIRYEKEPSSSSEGNFGKVEFFKAVPGQTVPKGVPERLAVKMAKDGGTNQTVEGLALKHEQQVATPLKEARMMVNATGTGASAQFADHLVRCQGVLRAANGGVMIAMDFAELGTSTSVCGKLHDALDAGKISERDFHAAMRSMFRDALAGAGRMRNLGAVHFDMRADNMLVDSNGRLVVADPVQAEQGSKTGSTTDGTVTPPEKMPIAWMAPEVLRKEEVTAASDMFTLGITFREMLLNQNPRQNHPLFPNDRGLTNMQIFQKVLDFAENPANKLIGDPDVDNHPQLARYRDLLNRMTHPDPKQRISIEEALRHEALRMPEETDAEGALKIIQDHGKSSAADPTGGSDAQNSTSLYQTETAPEQNPTSFYLNEAEPDQNETSLYQN